MKTKKIYGIAECDSAIYELTKQLTIKYSQDEYGKYRVFSPYESAPVASYFKGDNAENTWNRAQICKVNPESLTAEIVNMIFLSIFIGEKCFNTNVSSTSTNNFFLIYFSKYCFTTNL